MALTRKERTLGCLWAMACGDALGVPSSFLTPEQIQSKYGWIDTFYPPEKGHIFHDGLLAGEYTDDTEQSMALMNAYIRDKKVVPMSVVKEIIAWADRVKDKYASPLGPSTERALKNIAAGANPMVVKKGMQKAVSTAVAEIKKGRPCALHRWASSTVCAEAPCRSWHVTLL